MKTLLLFLSLIVTTSQAATVRLYFTDPLTNDKDTNAFYITPIGTNVLSSGGVVGRGVTTRYVPASNGYRTNTLAVGHYSITNRSLGSGVVIRVPDSSSLYDYTNILVSGYNIFVTITNGDSGTSGALTNNDTRAVTLTNLYNPKIRIVGAGDYVDFLTNESGAFSLATDNVTQPGLHVRNADFYAENIYATAGIFSGSGSGLTSVHGSNSISAGTISTNRMDATAYAAFVGGGDVTQSGLAAGSYDTLNSRFATNAPNGFSIASTNAPTFYGPLSVLPATSIFGADGQTVSLNGSAGPTFRSYQNYAQLLASLSGIKIQNQAGTETWGNWLRSGLTLQSNLTVNGYLTGRGGLLKGVVGSRDERAQMLAMPVPGLAWNPWGLVCWTNPITSGTNISEATVLNVATQLVTSGMVAAGWKSILLDAGHFQKERNANGNLAVASNMFPSGLNYLTSTLRGMGFDRVGAYTSYGTGQCSSTNVGTTPFGYEDIDVRAIANYGFNYLKVDACSPVASPSNNESPDWAYMVAGQFAQAISEAYSGQEFLDNNYPIATNREYMQLLISYNQNNHDNTRSARRGTASPLVLSHVNVLEESQIATAADDFSTQFRTNGLLRLNEQQWVRPGHYVELGESCFVSIYSTNTFRGNLYIQAMISSPINISYRTNFIEGGYVNYATNSGFIGIHQDIGVYPCVSLSSNFNYHIWRKPLALTTDQSQNREVRGHVLGLVNLSATTNQTFTITPSNCGVAPGVSYRVLDCARNLYIGEYDGFSSFSYTVSTNIMEMLRIEPIDKYAQTATASLFEKEEWIATRTDGAALIPGDLSWFYGAAAGGAVRSWNTATLTTNYPRQGIFDFGSTSTTLNDGVYLSCQWLYDGDKMPLARPDLWTNWSMTISLMPIVTNSVSYKLGLMGGTVHTGIADPTSGIYIRYATNHNNNSQWAFMVKNGATVSTNYLGVADINTWQTFRLFNDSGNTNVVRCQLNNGTIYSVTNGLGNTSLGREFTAYSLGSFAPRLWLDYFEFRLNSVNR